MRIYTGKQQSHKAKKKTIMMPNSDYSILKALVIKMAPIMAAVGAGNYRRKYMFWEISSKCTNGPKCSSFFQKREVLQFLTYPANPYSPRESGDAHK